MSGIIERRERREGERGGGGERGGEEKREFGDVFRLSLV